MATMGASVSIDGQELPSTYDGLAPAALDGLSFPWGRDDAYDQSDPGVLTMRMIDRDGTWSTSTSLIGQAVVVARTNPSVVMFRGSIITASPERSVVKNPRTGAREPVWIVTLTASSVPADLAAAVFVGPSTEGTVEGLGGWSEQGHTVRLDDLMAAGARSIVSDIEPNAVAAPAGVVRRVRSVDAADSATALELIERIYKLYILAAVNYDPAINRISAAMFAAASNVVLTYAGGRTSITLPTGRVIPAQRVGVPNGYQVESTASNAIDAVQVSYTWYGKDPALSPGSQKRTTYMSRMTQRTLSRATGRTRRILKVDSGLMTLDQSEFGFDVGPTNAAPGWLLGEVVKVVESLNGQLRLPVLRFDAERMPLEDASLTALIYSPMQATIPLYFAGSVFNPLQNAGPQYQIIGGTFTYENGWRHDVNLAPVRTSRQEPLSIQQVFGTTSASTWASYDDSIRLGDLDTITKGL